ncbi:hypothetical protein BALU111458_04960 [Bacillus luti]
MISDCFKLKVDIYKSFSPLPVIVLLLNILVKILISSQFKK